MKEKTRRTRRLIWDTTATIIVPASSTPTTIRIKPEHKHVGRLQVTTDNDQAEIKYAEESASNGD